MGKGTMLPRVSINAVILLSLDLTSRVLILAIGKNNFKLQASCYFTRCGRCKLQNVKVLNKGVDWSYDGNMYWKHDVKRSEVLKIVLHGNAEFEATDVVLQVKFYVYFLWILRINQKIIH